MKSICELFPILLLTTFISTPAFGFQGDLNIDGKIDLRDVILGLKVVSGIPETVNQRSDVGDDDRVGLEEVIFIHEYLAGYRENPALIDYNTIHSGQATYYEATGEGACGFDASPSNLMVAAVNEYEYYNSLPCGTYIEVSGPDGEVTVRIVDYCPTCDPGDIDLSEEAFALIAEPVLGVVPINWHFVEPDITDSIRYHFHEASHEWWTALQIRNHKHPISAVEVLDSNNRWVAFDRTNWNYFIAPSGMGLGPFTIRATDYFDQSITDSGISFTPGLSVEASAQFPSL